MSPALTFWTAVAVPLVLPMLTPNLRWLAGVAVLGGVGIFALLNQVQDNEWAAIVTFCALASWFAGVALRLMLAFVRRLLDV